MRIIVRSTTVTAEPPRTLPPRAPSPPANALRLPVVAQPDDHTCAPASALSVLRYVGAAGDETVATLAAEMGTSADGTDYQPIADALVARGLEANVDLQLTLAELTRHVRRGDVVIMCFNAWPDDGHYAVVVAADERGVWLMDPYMLPDGDGVMARGFVPAGEIPERFYAKGRGAGIVVTMTNRPVEQRTVLHARCVE